jgi:hypothetical protein
MVFINLKSLKAFISYPSLRNSQKRSLLMNGPQRQSGHLGEGKNLLHLLGFRTPDHSTHNLAAILTTLTWLNIKMYLNFSDQCCKNELHFVYRLYSETFCLWLHIDISLIFVMGVVLKVQKRSITKYVKSLPAITTLLPLAEDGVRTCC